MDECQLYSVLLELKLPWKAERVSLDSIKKTVEIYITHEKGSKLLCPMCRKECMVYDHLRERVWRDLDSIEFMTFVHANPPGISCQEHGIIEAVIPWAEKTSRFTMRFETRSIRMLQNMDTFNFTGIMKLSWKQAWNILERAVKRGRDRKNGHPSIIGRRNPWMNITGRLQKKAFQTSRLFQWTCGTHSCHPQWNMFRMHNQR
ncbi:MAG: hypothetical protein B2I17_06765 [Thermoplasmatales archaeon B_DKE]|nr:MAG: hypothetical protein B2I17_06765 [Thermoplasmatales archaeon B_DKE]